MAETWKKVAYTDDAPAAHKDSHDPEDGGDSLDCAAAGEIVGVTAAAEGDAHSFARSNHTHQIQASIADDHILTVDDASAADDEICRFTATGVEGITPATLAAAMALDDIGVGDAALDMNGQDIANGGVIFLTEQAEAEADVEGKGQIWVNTATPNELWFTDDAGTDFQLGLGAAHALLNGSTHSDTTDDAVTQGSIIIGNDTPAWDELVVGDANDFLGTDGTDVAWRSAADSMAALSGAAAAAFDLNGQQLQNHVLHVVANAAGRPDPVVGEICWQTDELAIYVCTVAA